MKKLCYMFSSAMLLLVLGCSGSGSGTGNESKAPDTGAVIAPNDSSNPGSTAGTDPITGRQDSSAAKDKGTIGPGNGQKTGTESGKQKYN